jgi:hypothetical protein
MTELNEYKRFDRIRSCDTVLFGYMAKHGLGVAGVRPDGYTVDLENDVIDYENINKRDNLRRM